MCCQLNLGCVLLAMIANSFPCPGRRVMSDKVRACLVSIGNTNGSKLSREHACLSKSLSTSWADLLSAVQSTPLQHMLSKVLARGAAQMGIPFASPLQEVPAAWEDRTSSGHGCGDRELLRQVERRGLAWLRPMTLGLVCCNIHRH